MTRAETFDLRAELLGSFLQFTQVFYKLRTGREFELSEPVGRESHFITVARELTKVFHGETNRLIINVPPRYGKTEMVIHFCNWALAHYPDSNFLYVSYSHTLAKKQTQTIRQIAGHAQYRKMFNIGLSADTSAKDNFETTAGGSVYAAGAGGSITGRGAGIQNCNRFGGAIIIDDIHKPKDVHSDTIRGETNNWFLNTLQSRVNSPTTPIIMIAQRLHEDDLCANLLQGFDGSKWELVSLKALDSVGNALHPTMHSVEKLRSMQEVMPYEFSAQYQQEPQPAGGGIFKSAWFPVLPEEPEILATFITADTAETDKTYNDATVFSFWGVYKVYQAGVETGVLALHWLDCHETWIEPKDLESEFDAFYADCMRYKIKPKFVAIEKKSTGVTLSSVINNRQGIRSVIIERTSLGGNKTHRFLSCQPYVAKKLISLPQYGKHTHNCITHMSKITANDSHRRDDIADTLADAINLALIDKYVYTDKNYDANNDLVAKRFADSFNKHNTHRVGSWQK